MSGEDGYFDEPVAARVRRVASRRCSSPERVDPVVDLLVELAGDGRALELGDRHRPDRACRWRSAACRCTASSSRARWSRGCARSPGREEIGVTIGDFATATADGTFTVAYLVFNTILNVTTQAEQVACFRNVAAHLEPGGCFVIEVMVPDLQRLPPGRDRRVRST